MTSRTGVEQEPGYVLHRRAYRETSLIVDLLTLNHGRISLVARGANASKSPLKAQLQPFQPLLLGWQGRSDLKTLTSTEGRPGPTMKKPGQLYCGFYLNELILRLIPPFDPSPDLFASYIETLEVLSGITDFEPVLRRFESTLMSAMGYGFSWAQAMDTGQPVKPGRSYFYDPQQGILEQATEGSLLQGLPGDVLLLLAADDLTSKPARLIAKRVMRVLIDHLLQGRPLHSRNLFTSLRGDCNENESATGR